MKRLKIGIDFYERFRVIFPKTIVFILTNVSREDVRDFFEKQKNCFFDRKDDIMPIEFAKKVNDFLLKKEVNYRTRI